MNARGPTLVRRCLGLLVAVAAAAPTTVRANSAPAAEATEDLGALWREAQARMGTSDYAGAIEILTRVYASVTNDPDARALRARVQWSLHEAHLGAFETDGDPKHLYVARDLLNKYTADVPATDAPQRKKAEASLAVLETRIVELEKQAAEEARESELEREREQAAEPQPEREPEPEPRPQPDVGPSADPRAGRGLIIAGSVTTSLGVVGTLLLIGGLASSNAAVNTFEEEPDERDDARDSIRLGNALGIAGGVIAGVFTVTGAVLLAVGVRRRSAGRRARVEASPAGLAVRF